MPHNIRNASIAYVGEKPWHGLGTQVPANVGSARMIQAANLDWEVEKRPARGASLAWARKPELMKPGAVIGPCDEVEYSRYEIVRKPRSAAEQETVLGLVSARYEPLQNKDAFAFFDPIVDQKTAFFETAGALGDGEKVWVMARMRGDIEVVRGDSCHKYLLLSNSHNGQGSVVVKFTAVRVVCQNTLMMAMEDGQAIHRVRHSKLVKDRLEEVATIIAAANEVYAAAATMFKAMAAMQLKSAQLDTYMGLVFPKTKNQIKEGLEPERWPHIRRLFDSHADLQLPGVKGTLWAAYNAMTYFEDHKVVDQEGAGGRLDRVWFGGGADIKVRALTKAREFAGLN